MTVVPKDFVASPAQASLPEQVFEPTWALAKIFPAQGQWSDEEYLSIETNKLAELSHGCFEVLTMPTDLHQAIVAFLFEALLMYIRPGKLGTVRFAPLRLRLRPGKFREPDVLFLEKAHDELRGNDFWSFADLVMEVVSDDDRRRDLDTKRHEYAWAGIPEYWIVDPMKREITVLTLPAGAEQYTVHGTFTIDQRATSVLLPGFEVAVVDVFAVK